MADIMRMVSSCLPDHALTLTFFIGSEVSSDGSWHWTGGSVVLAWCAACSLTAQWLLRAMDLACGGELVSSVDPRHRDRGACSKLFSGVNVWTKLSGLANVKRS